MKNNNIKPKYSIWENVFKNEFWTVNIDKLYTIIDIKVDNKPFDRWETIYYTLDDDSEEKYPFIISYNDYIKWEEETLKKLENEIKKLKDKYD